MLKKPIAAVPYSYLAEQFDDPEPLFDHIRQIVASGDFTLGQAVQEFENRFAGFIGASHAIGVNSGTDALRLSLKAVGVGPGDEVLTCANTFIATVGAIADVGARPIFVDCAENFLLNVELVERALTPRTKAVIPVHLAGDIVDMKRLLEITQPRGIPVIEDACQAFGSTLNGRHAGSWGATGTFSLHPLKFLNIWGDGGVIVTNDDELATRLRLLRNHGLIDRDRVVMMGCNSRLDTIQAVVAGQTLDQAQWIIERRNRNATFYDHELFVIPQVKIPRRSPGVRHTFVTYQILAEDRDNLLEYSVRRGVECKVHYPTPLYCQEGLKPYGYRYGDFPMTDQHALSTLTLPVHQYLSHEQLATVVEAVRDFYRA
jgi:dTDP-3-amino-2,3,6-trideoxy-4-keto-D-glucose/dTDP-3-amino-3,4,6-trideoxy-alpha-D-glucose/dTDP-2,6-dideoxy-D-kanosamine transaminase